MSLNNISKWRENRAHLELAGGDSSGTGDQFSEDTTSSLNTKGKSDNIDKENILSAFFPSEDTTLDGSTKGNCLIGVDTLRRLLAKELLEELLNLGDTSRPTDEYNLVNKLNIVPRTEKVYVLHRCLPSSHLHP